jgi:hypothetical protein
MSFGPRVRFFVPLVVVGAAAALLGATASRLLTPDAAPPRVVSVDPSQTLEPDFDSATARISGTAGSMLLRSLSSAVTGADSVIAIVLTAEDCLTCEDLGRQLRELRRSTPLRVVIAAESISVAVVTTFLAREHLVAVPVIAIPHTSVLADGRPFTTPAAFIVTMASGEASGVSHTRRFKYARARSFREELGFGGAEVEDPVGSRNKQGETP